MFNLKEMSLEEKKRNPYIRVYYVGNDVSFLRPLYVVVKNNKYIYSATNLLNVLSYEREKGCTIKAVHNQEELDALNLDYEKYMCCIEK